MQSLNENEHSQFENSECLEQARALAVTPEKRAAKESAPAPLKPVRIGRPSYAEAQWQIEWNQNRRAKEIVANARDGFL